MPAERARAGLTLLELLIALAIIAMVVTSTASLVIGSLRLAAASAARHGEAAAAAAAIELLRQDLHQALPQGVRMQPIRDPGRVAAPPERRPENEPPPSELIIATLHRVPGDPPGPLSVRWWYDAEARAVRRAAAPLLAPRRGGVAQHLGPDAADPDARTVIATALPWRLRLAGAHRVQVIAGDGDPRSATAAARGAWTALLSTPFAGRERAAAPPGMDEP